MNSKVDFSMNMTDAQHDPCSRAVALPTRRSTKAPPNQLVAPPVLPISLIIMFFRSHFFWFSRMFFGAPVGCCCCWHPPYLATLSLG